MSRLRSRLPGGQPRLTIPVKNSEVYTESGCRTHTGIVKCFDPAKGYGFIERLAGENVFVHYSAIRGKGRRNLREGEEVEFEIAEGRKGLRAVNVRSPSRLRKALRAHPPSSPVSTGESEALPVPSPQPQAPGGGTLVPVERLPFELLPPGTWDIKDLISY